MALQKVGTSKNAGAGASGKSSPKLSQRIVMGFDPDEMESGGLLGSGEGFDGVIGDVDIILWDYKGKSHEVRNGKELGWITTVRVQYIPDEDTGLKPDYDYYTAANIGQFLPSKDGINPIELPEDMDDLIDNPDLIEELSGKYFVWVGKERKDGVYRLNNSTKWAEFLINAKRAEVPKELMDQPQIDFLSGLRGHFGRVRQQERSGLNDGGSGSDSGDGKKRGAKDILVIQEVYQLPGAAANKAATAKSKPASAAASTSASAASNVKAKAKVAVVEEEPEEEDEEITEEEQTEAQDGSEDKGSEEESPDEFSTRIHESVFAQLWKSKDGTLPLQTVLRQTGKEMKSGSDKVAMYKWFEVDDNLTSIPNVDYDAKRKEFSL